jgi:hypothetical protein
MSDAEEQLKTVTAGEDWSLVGAEEFRLAAETLAKAVHELTVNSSLTGKAATAAESAAMELSTQLGDVVSSITTMQGIVEEANAYRATLRGELDDLPGTPGWLVTAVRTAEVGTVIQSGGLSVVAGEGALALVHAFFGDKRDDEAKQKLAAATTKLDELARRLMAAEPGAEWSSSDGDGSGDGTGDGSGSDDGTDGGGTDGSERLRLRVVEPPTLTVDPPPTGGPLPEPPRVDPRPPITIGDPIVDPVPGPPYVERPWPVWPDPTTPDSGHHDPGSTTLPGGGAGGSGVGSSGSSAARGLSGAVLGGSSLAGAGLASRFGAGGFGTGTGSAAGPGAVGGAAGGLVGSGRGLAGAGAGAAESAGGAAAGRGGAGMMAGGAGGRGEGKDSKRRGLGGIVAPTLDDDPDAVPLPPSAGSGSR